MNTNNSHVLMSGQKISLIVESTAIEDGFWDIVAEVVVSAKSNNTDWVGKTFYTRTIDTNPDLALSTALVNLMEQVGSFELKEELESMIESQENEQTEANDS